MTLISVSPRAMETEVASHYFSFYQAITDSCSRNGKKHIVINYKKKNQTLFEFENFRNILRKSYSQDFFSIPKLPTSFMQDARKIEKVFHEENTFKLHIYECNIRELLLLARIVKRNEEVRAIANFQQAAEWATLMSDQRIVSRILKRHLTNLIMKLNHQVSFTAESQELSVIMNKHEIKNVSYPNATVLSSTFIKKSKNDVVFFPSNLTEWLICLNVSEKLLDFNNSLKLTVISKNSYADQEKKYKVKLISGFVPTEEYRQILIDSEAVVLPYVSKFHRWGSSGKLFDALLFNCRTHVPADSALSTMEVADAEIVGFNIENAESEIYENLIKYSLEKERNVINQHVPRVDDTVGFLFKELEKIKSSEKPTIISRVALEREFWILSLLYLIYFSPNDGPSAVFKRKMTAYLSSLLNILNKRRIFRLLKKYK
ncbi:hypothetical protein MCEGKSH29_00033 [Candidatus Nanopelagicaceae bacterium]